MEFSTFQRVCKYAVFAYDDPDDHRWMTLVCKKKIPPGNSWGKCDEAHCPFWGINIQDIKIYKDGELVGKAESGKIVYE